MALKEQGKQGDKRDTLYFNAFTEDLFSWDNNLDGDSKQVLRLNSNSRFLRCLEGGAMEPKIRLFLWDYADFDFKIHVDEWVVRFFRKVRSEENNIKVSRSEENIFIWCFFLAVVGLAMDKDTDYSWVKYLYIDDPISSLDENNAVAVGHRLAQKIKNEKHSLKTVISSHHPLFFNVLSNELSNADRYFLSKRKSPETYALKKIGRTPFFYHVSVLKELCEVAKSGKIYTYHFNILRSILEKTASFHGYKSFTCCIKKDDGDSDEVLHARLINLLSHRDYSLYEPQEMLQENQDAFGKILKAFVKKYHFNINSSQELEKTNR